MSANKLREAEDTFSIWIDAHPQDPEAYEGRALVYGKMKKWTEALLDAEKLVSMFPKNTDYLYEKVC